MGRFASRYRCWVVAALTIAMPSICKAQGNWGGNSNELRHRWGTIIQFVVPEPFEAESLSLSSTIYGTRGDERRSNIEFFIRARVQILALAIASQRLSDADLHTELWSEFGEATLGEQISDLGSMTSVLSLLSLMESIPVESSAAWSIWQEDGLHRPQMLPRQVISDVSRSMWRRLSVGLAISSGLLIGTGGLLVRSNSARFPHFRGYLRPQWSKRKIGLLFSGRF